VQGPQSDRETDFLKHRSTPSSSIGYNLAHHAFALVVSDLVLAAKWQTLVADLLVAGLALQVSSAQYNKELRVEQVTGG
jgi:hypothetical protein